MDIRYSYRNYYFTSYGIPWQCPLCQAELGANEEHVLILSSATLNVIGSLCVNCIRDILASKEQILKEKRLP